MSPGAPDSPLRVAIVGSGPAGFYAAEHLLRRDGVAVEVDILDKLPTPHGLVRAGVAPDHPKIKSVTRMYDKTAARPGFRFFGNVEVGHDLAHADLADRYHAVVYAVGAQTDRHLGIPGEDLPGSHAATEFVAWYNAHPDFADREFDLTCGAAVVVGNGNVAMDVARMLALTREELAVTDVADHALEALGACRVRDVHVLGRRGPAQAAFTNPEIREMGELAAADVIVDPSEVELDPLSRAYLESDEADITARKNVEILEDFSQREPEGKPKQVMFRFLVSPVEIIGTDRVEGVRIARNELVRDAGGRLRAQATEEHEVIPCGLVLRSIGYRGEPLPGVPFDERRGVIPNEGGRVLDGDGGKLRQGDYAVGWIKRGPTGVIGTNKKDAQETVDLIFEDLEAGVLPEPADPRPEAIDELLGERAPDHVTFTGWEAIDRAERARGEPQGRPRVKFTRVADMIDASRAQAPD